MERRVQNLVLDQFDIAVHDWVVVAVLPAFPLATLKVSSNTYPGVPLLMVDCVQVVLPQLLDCVVFLLGHLAQKLGMVGDSALLFVVVDFEVLEKAAIVDVFAAGLVVDRQLQV